MGSLGLSVGTWIGRGIESLLEREEALPLLPLLPLLSAFWGLVGSPFTASISAASAFRLWGLYENDVCFDKDEDASCEPPPVSSGPADGVSDDFPCSATADSLLLFADPASAGVSPPLLPSTDGFFRKSFGNNFFPIIVIQTH